MGSKITKDIQHLIVKLLAFLIFMVLLIVIHIRCPDFFSRAIAVSTSGDINATLEFLRSFGYMAIVVSFLADVFINALGFLPSIFISTANGLLFGIPMGILVSWTAESVGVIISFLLMRYVLRSSAEKLIAKSKKLSEIDEYSSKRGLGLMIIARTLPYVPSGILTAIGAVSKMSVRDYCIATFIGKFPSTVIEVVVGHDVVNFHEHMMRLTGFVIVATLIFGGLLWRQPKLPENPE